MDKRERVARAICAEKCAFMGEPPCYSVEGEWPNPNCSEPGCHAEAQAAIAALEPVTVRTCAKCGHPENNHPYRHPFVALAQKDAE